MRKPSSFRPKASSVLITLALVLSLLPAFTIQAIVTGASSSPSVVARVKPILTVGGYQYKDLNASGEVDPYENWMLPVEDRVDDLLSRMTIVEKVAQMIHLTLVSPREELFRDNNIGFVLAYTSLSEGPRYAAEFTNKLQEWSENSRLGIPVVVSMDSVMGVSWVRGATVYPDQPGLAATENVDLVRALADMQREESLAVGVRMTMSPIADVATEPRWGRVQETFGENADLAAEMVRAMLEGLQGLELDENSVLACVKHFPGSGPQENGKDGRPIVFSEDTIWYHLKTFQAAIEAGALAIMPYGYSTVPYLGGDAAVNTAHESKVVMDLLRENLGFNGLIQTDWGKNFVLSANNGADIIGGAGIRDIGGIASGVSGERIDDAVRRILTAKFKLGIFEDPYVDPDYAEQIVGCEEHKLLALEAARQAMTLVKNDGILPLGEDMRILVAGGMAGDVNNLSSGWKVSQPGDSILEAIDKVATVVYEPDNVGRAAELAENCDVAVVVVGEPPYAHDGFWGFSHLYLSDLQSDMLRAIHGTGIPLVVVVVMPRPYAIPWCAANANAILVAYRPGTSRGAQAVAEVLFGDYDPSGKLPMQIPRSMDQVEAQREDLPYDIEDPLYPYGFGLTYLSTDETPPSAFDLLTPENGATVLDRMPTLRWGASSDLESGIAYYEVWLDGINVENTATAEYTTPELSVGPHSWYVVAVNGAGLSTRSTSTYTFIVISRPTLEGTAEVTPMELPPEVLSVVPSESEWDPWETYEIAVTVRDNNGLTDLDNVVVMAYSSPLGPTSPDSTRDHYTWWYDGSWHSSLGAGYIVPENCSAPDPSENEGTYVFAVKLAKTAEPGAWDLYAEAVDSYENRDSLENAEAVSVWVYTEFSLDRYVLVFSGMQGETVGPEFGPSVVTVTTNEDFDIQVRLSGPWTYDNYTIPMSATKAITAEGEFTLSGSFQAILTDVGFGESVVGEIDWRLDMPVHGEPGEYHTTFYVNVVHEG